MLHDELNCQPSFLTKVTRKTHKCIRPRFYDSRRKLGECAKNKQNYNFPATSVFCLAHIFGIHEQVQDPSDDDESTHSSPCENRRPTHVVRMARQRKRRTRAQDLPTPVVEGDSEIEAAAQESVREDSKARRVRFRPKDEVITIQMFDVQGPKGDGDNVSIVGTELVEIVELPMKKVYRGIRQIRKPKPGKAKAISSSGKNDDTDVEVPSLTPSSDASVPDMPFVRSDVLGNYRRARDNGLPELSRKNFNLLVYLVAIMRSVLLRRNLKGSEEECHAYLHDGNDGVVGRIIRPPMTSAKAQEQHTVIDHLSLIHI